MQEVTQNSNFGMQQPVQAQKEVEEELEEVRIRKIGVMSFALLSMIINVFIGLVIGVVFALLAIFGVEMTGADELGGFAFVIGIAAIIVFPIIFGIIGFINGLIGAVLFNLGAKITKGLKIYS